jgi:hypothetical protein
MPVSSTEPGTTTTASVLAAVGSTGTLSMTRISGLISVGRADGRILPIFVAIVGGFKHACTPQ